MGIFSFFYLLLWATFVADVEAYLGVNYGRVGDNIAPPNKVVELLQFHGINSVKIFDTDATVLDALANTGIAVVVCLPNDLLSSAANAQSFTDNWVEANITKFYPATKIQAIAVGNEVFANPTYLTPFMVPAMKNVYASLQKFKINDIIVSSPIPFTALRNSSLPSDGTFNPDLIEPVMKPMLDFLRQTKSFLMVNLYPFFTYMDKPKDFDLDYVLGKYSNGFEDSGNGNKYSSLFVAQVDTVYAAMSKLQYDDVRVIVTETGWPSKGDNQEIGANVDNAAAYNGNLVRRVLTECGTPLRPSIPLYVFQFGLFNENKKPGPTSERNYGLFYPTGLKVYKIALTSEQLKSGPKKDFNITSVPAPPPIAKPPPVPHGDTWCVANANAGADKLKAGLEFVCGAGGADCSPIQPGSTCFNPDSLEYHASYAFNSYYWKKGRADESCDFNGAASVVDKLPQYGGCELQTGSNNGTTPTSGTPPTIGTSPTSGTPPSSGTSPAAGTPPATGTPTSGTTPSSGTSPATGTPTSGTTPSSGTSPTTGTSPATGTTSPATGDVWCIANPNAGADKLQAGLEYACGEGGADCDPIQAGGTCYNPNTLEAHASYAFNSYYQKNNRADVACNFGGAASIVAEIPVFGDCKFPTGP